MISKAARNFRSFPINNDISSVKLQVLNWADRFNTCSFFDNNKYASGHHSFECLLAAGVKRSCCVSLADAAGRGSFERLRRFYDDAPDWLFGHFAYDLKNETETLTSGHPDGVNFPDLYFFVPEYIIKLSTEEIAINSETDVSPEDIWEQIRRMPGPPDASAASQSSRGFQLAQDTHSSQGSNSSPGPNSSQGWHPSEIPLSPVQVKSRFSPEEYEAVVKKLQDHILKGDCYEINFCQEFYAEDAVLHPLTVYRNLSRVSPNPFSAYYRLDDKYLLCASPERYLRKVKDQVISQPIKGTEERETENDEKDKMNKERLRLSEKDRAENVMIVDLVRNDLSRVCEEGSVKVDELFSVYAFPQVYQMISTVSGKVNAAVHWTDMIRATFPMGSMTGAPKKKVMELIEQYEKTKRGIYSGALGYVTPEGDFDFNVVIRSIALNTTKRYLSYQVGSAITYKSNSRHEYRECLLKAAAIEKVLTFS